MAQFLVWLTQLAVGILGPRRAGGFQVPDDLCCRGHGGYVGPPPVVAVRGVCLGGESRGPGGVADAPGGGHRLVGLAHVG